MITYIVMGLILLISSIFALNFGNKITRALRTNDQMSLTAGFAGVRNYFAFWAILMIICLLLMLIGVADLATSAILRIKENFEKCACTGALFYFTER